MNATRIRLGPADHGRELTNDEYEQADFEGGHRYELIDGRLEVSPRANPPEDFLEKWLYDELSAYCRTPGHLPMCVTGGRTFVPDRPRETVPEPDLAVYRGTRRDLLARGHWRNSSPLVVVEILVEGDPRKDLERNVELYLAVPSVREYWVLDGRADVFQPELIRHRRRGARWVVRTFPAGATVTTPLLPGFALVLDPLAEPT